MNKLLLLTRSHLRKNKGTSIGLLFLMLIASMLIGVSLLLMLDAVPLAKKEAARLDAGDGIIRITGGKEAIDDDFIVDCLGDDVERYFISKGLQYSDCSFPFNDGTVLLDAVVVNSSAYDREMARAEIISEDTSVTSDYVILPYIFHSTGNVEIGDDFSIELKGTKENLKVRGFSSTPYFAGTNLGAMELILDDDTYAKLYEKDSETNSCTMVPYELKEGVKQSRFSLKVDSKIIVKAPDSQVSLVTMSNTVTGRTFMSMIIAVSNISTTAVILVVILLMLVSSISNYVRENMKTIGALKAVGYTSKDLNRSLVIQFITISTIGSIIGAGCSYLLMPLIAKFAVAQVGIPYHVSFNVICTVIPVVSVILYTFILAVLSLRKTRKIEPIVALREGVADHNFKRNHFALDKSRSGLNVNLGLKTMMANKKQNAITFFVVGGIMFLCIMSLLMFWNFNLKPKYEIMAFETCGAAITAEPEYKDEVRKFLSDNGGSNVRELDTFHLTYNDEERFHVYITEDASKLNNQNGLYKGKFPKYDNEVALSGKFAREYDFEIGDEIKLDLGDKSYTYVITGFLQSANNLGREGIVTLSGAKHVFDMDKYPSTFYVDTDGREASDELIKKCSDEFGDHLLSKANFYESMEGSLSTFKNLATMMLIIIAAISAIVIILVLFLLIKVLIYNKRKDYGIYKAIGYTSRDLILQTALSFMPSIVISSIVFSFVSYFVANPYMNIVMMAFGICKADFDIPVPGVAIIAVCVNVLSFAFALFEARKIKKIEAYNMLIAE